MSQRALADARSLVDCLFAAALEAVEPACAVLKTVHLVDDSLVVQGEVIPTPLGIHVVAVGKAAVAMSRGALEGLSGAIVSGDVITKEGHAAEPLPELIRVYEAGHPIPDQRGVDATQCALDALETLTEGTVVLALISGGGSALLEAPKMGLTLADFERTTELLLRAGAPIEDLNAVRAPLSRVKAGGLRAAAPQATWVTLILSDVLGNDPQVIASGPTIPGRNDPKFALQIIDRYSLREALPAVVVSALQAAPQAQSTDTGGDVLQIIGDNASAVDAAAEEARSRGLETQIVWRAAQGEAARLGRDFVALVAEVLGTVDVVLGGGEATVTVRGDGTGGRNTEFTLAAALELEKRALAEWVVASLGTDGQDAMTGVAGAIADSGSAQRSRQRGVDPLEALQRNDSLAVFEATGGAIRTGPTGTNVNDLYIAVRMRAAEDQNDVERD